jgi:hypothetical protein
LVQTEERVGEALFEKMCSKNHARHAPNDRIPVTTEKVSKNSEVDGPTK